MKIERGMRMSCTNQSDYNVGVFMHRLLARQVTQLTLTNFVALFCWLHHAKQHEVYKLFW